jgi:hypothetical protein
LDSWPQLPPPVSRGCRKSHTQRTIADQPQRSPGVSCVFADISQVSAAHYPPTSHRLSKYHTVCRSAWLCHRLTCSRNRFEHILVMPMLTRTHPDDGDVDPNSSEGVDPSSSEGVDTMSSEGVDTMLTQTYPALLLNCSPYSSRTCPVDVSFGCRNLVYP